jgi:D-alanine transaminase
MTRFAYVNGRFVRHGDATVHIEDRGYQFADGVYEVWAVFGGRLSDAAGHFDRLSRSLAELRIAEPMSPAALQIVLRQALRLNRIKDGVLYLQVTRGVARRDHAFPHPEVKPSIVVTAKRVDLETAEARAATGVSVLSVPENRWGRCDIKTIGLLPNVLAKQAAKEAGAAEAWFVDDLGLVTEGASSNAWIVDRDGVLRTRSIQANILRGITRNSILHLAQKQGVGIDERPFTVEEAMSAREAFITGAGALVLPVVKIDGEAIGDGLPGPMAKRLRQLYIEDARRDDDLGTA